MRCPMLPSAMKGGPCAAQSASAAGSSRPLPPSHRIWPRLLHLAANLIVPKRSGSKGNRPPPPIRRLGKRNVRPPALRRREFPPHDQRVRLAGTKAPPVLRSITGRAATRGRNRWLRARSALLQGQVRQALDSGRSAGLFPIPCLTAKMVTRPAMLAKAPQMTHRHRTRRKLQVTMKFR